MPDLLVQFHAVLDELVDIAHMAAAVPSFPVAFRFAPFAAAIVDGEKVLEAAIRDPSVRELAFTLVRPNLPVANTLEFFERNQGALRLDVGRLSERGLHESAISCRTNDVKALERWRSVAQRLRKSTRVGAIAVSSLTGAKSRLRNHRFTEGASALAESGVAILPVAGTATLLLGESKG